MEANSSCGRYHLYYSSNGWHLKCSDDAWNWTDYENNPITDVGRNIEVTKFNSTQNNFDIFYNTISNTQIRHLPSSDGIKDIDISNSSVLISNASSDIRYPGVVEFNGSYYLYYMELTDHWRIYLATSDNISSGYEKMGVVVDTGQTGFDELQSFDPHPAVINGKVILFYTGGNGQGEKLGMAYSTNGINFTKWLGNPIIPGDLYQDETINMNFEIIGDDIRAYFTSRDYAKTNYTLLETRTTIKGKDILLVESKVTMNNGAIITMNRSYSYGYYSLLNPSNNRIVLRTNISEDITENIYEGVKSVLLANNQSETYSAEFDLNFSQDIDFSNVSSDSNKAQRKSVVHGLSEISQISNKSLLIPRTENSGRIYVCPGAQTLSDVNVSCPNYTIINSGETVDGMTVSETIINGENYYKVSNITGTGGAEIEIPTTTEETEQETTSSGSGILFPSSLQLKEGYSKLLRKNQKVQMSINEQTSTAVVKSVNNTNKKVEVKLEEINKTFELSENETQKIDLDDDGYYDLQISCKAVQTNGYAELEFKEIHEEVPASEQEEQESPSKTEFEIKNWMWIVGGLIGLVVIGVVVRRVLKSRNS